VTADPESKGGSEATVRNAKADPLPPETNLRSEYGSFAEMGAACLAFGERVNARAHAVTGHCRRCCWSRNELAGIRSRG
jgi:hypothetical protein